MFKILAAIAAAQFLLTACDQSAPPKPPKPIAGQAQQDSRLSYFHQQKLSQNRGLTPISGNFLRQASNPHYQAHHSHRYKSLA